MSDQVAPVGEQTQRDTAARLNSGRLRLLLAAFVFIGWLGYLSYAALTKNRDPIISRVQAAVAKVAIVGEVTAGPDGKPAPEVLVVEALAGGDTEPGSKVTVVNLPDAQGFTGAGRYLLLMTAIPPGLVPQHENPDTNRKFSLVGQQRSPGHDLAGVGKPLIYTWTDGMRMQFEKMPK
jgi:hypothetical protein